MSILRFSLPLLFTLMIQATAVLAAQPCHLQTHLTERDRQIIEYLTEVAQRNAPSVREARASLGLAPFDEVIILGLSTNQSSSDTTEPEVDRFQSNNLSAEVYIDVVRTIIALQSLPARRAQLRDAKRQVRVAVVTAYVTYLQAKQLQQIAIDRMATLSTESPPSLENEAYIAAATELLAANSNLEIALETLAAVVGRSPTEILNLLQDI